MRIEEVNSGQFVKLPNSLEQTLIKTINRFFTTDPESLKNSREAIILELQKRIQPMVSSMVKRIAWLEGEQIFKDQLRSVIDEETSNILNTVMDTISQFRHELVKPVDFDFEIVSDINTINIPTAAMIDPVGDIIHIYVNGMLQRENKAYILTTNVVGKLDSIVFSSNLDAGDLVEVRCMVFTDDTVTQE